jgi:hypothetical protein
MALGGDWVFFDEYQARVYNEVFNHVSHYAVALQAIFEAYAVAVSQIHVMIDYLKWYFLYCLERACLPDLELLRDTAARLTAVFEDMVRLFQDQA